MKFKLLRRIVILALMVARSASANVLYVDAGSANPTPPYATWSTAATNIQDAVGLSQSGDTVMVTNGVYFVGIASDQVSISNTITLESVNGPQVTTILGAGNSLSGVIINPPNAVVSGFTVTDFSLGVTGPVNCIVTNCIITGNSGRGGITGTKVYDCVIANNVAIPESYIAGGANGSILYDCIVSNNVGDNSGGANTCFLTNCFIVKNNERGNGGGAYSSTLVNCVVAGNVSPFAGGGTFNCNNYNCTIAGNSASSSGGGTDGGNCYYCIVYSNSAPTSANWTGGSFQQCCTFPAPGGYPASITNNPVFVGPAIGDYRLQCGSPCIDVSPTIPGGFTQGIDIRGVARPINGLYDLGAYEYDPAIDQTVVIQTSLTNFATGYPVPFTGYLGGCAAYFWWNFGDGDVVSNELAVSHAWTTPGTYNVQFSAYYPALGASVTATSVVQVVQQPVYYVAQFVSTPVFPYTNWATAAYTIQDAIAAATVPGSLVLVSNGVYQVSDGPLVTNTDSTRSGIALTNVVVVQSLNGPANTVIQPFNVRCAYVGHLAILGGFTLANASISGSGGGVWSDPAGTVTNCVITRNVAETVGGGAYQGNFYNCIFSNNGYNDYPVSGGAAYQCNLYDCLVVSNRAGLYGGGAYGGVISNCTLIGNTTVNNGDGGGAASNLLYDCMVAGNTATLGGGAYYSTLFNCTVVTNRATYGAGLYGGAFYNSIVYFNNNADLSGLTYGYYSCTPVLPLFSFTCITSNPLFVNLAAGDYHLQPASPCINSGTNGYATGGTDLDGNPRIVGGTVDMGAYEFNGAIHYVNVSGTDPVAPYTSWSAAAIAIQDAVDAASPGDEILVTNGVYQTGGETVYGSPSTNRVAVNMAVTVQSVNGPAVTSIVGASGIRCVFLTNGAALSGFTITNGTPVLPDLAYNGNYGGGVNCWSTNATVTNCVLIGNTATVDGGGAAFGTLNNCTLTANSAGYGGGAYDCRLNNCTLTGNSSTNSGGGASISRLNYCALNGNSAAHNGGGAASSTLNNCALTNNSVTGANGYGGGAFSSMLNSCTLTGNSAGGSGQGGGASGCTLNYCILTGNTANFGGGAVGSTLLGNTLNNCILTGNMADFGGGAVGAILNNCTVTGNSATNSGSGLYSAVANNCIVYYNTAQTDTNYDASSTLNYCCTTPLFTNGLGNFTNAPLFVNLAAGDFHLLSNSPCINSGNNAYVPTTTDLDGNPRIVGGTVDVGAYEYQTPTSVISYAYLQQYGLPTDGSVDFADLDGNGMNVDQDWIAGLDPTNALSVLQMTAPSYSPSGIVVQWQSVNTRTYFLNRSSDLTANPAFVNVASNIVGLAGATTYTDTNAVGTGPFFYRVGVQQ